MKTFLLSSSLLGVLLFAPQGFSSEGDESPYSFVKKGMITKVKSKIFRNERKGDTQAVTDLNLVLNALQGNDLQSVYLALPRAKEYFKNAESWYPREFWEKVIANLEKIQDVQSSEHGYGFVKKGTISKVVTKIQKREEKGDTEGVANLNIILDALSGVRDLRSLQQAFAVADGYFENAESWYPRDFWKKVLANLDKIQDVQLSEYNYQFNAELTDLMLRRMKKAPNEAEADAWRTALLDMALKNGGAGIEDLLDFVENGGSDEDSVRVPKKWDELSGALQAYALEVHDDMASFEADVRPENAYDYKIYDSPLRHELDPVYSIDGSSTRKSHLSGSYGTEKGQVEWKIKNAPLADGDRNYLSYGYWSRSRVPAGREDDNYNERQTAVFYNGDSPAGNLDGVTGKAQYSGDTVGTIRKNTSESAAIDSFRGDMSLKVDFDSDTITGSISNISDPRLGGVGMSGTFDSTTGEISGTVDQHRGEWNGQFYNSGENPTDAPEHVGGSYSYTTGLEKDDLTVEGAFGAKFVPAE